MIKDIERAPELPRYRGLDINAFSGLFRNTDTSYKFLWTLSILDLCGKNSMLTSENLAANMLKIARPLIQKHRFRFGAKDKIKTFLDEQDAGDKHLPDFIIRQLLTLVPYRLLSPFFVNETKNLSVNAKNRLIRRLANERYKNGRNPPLYRFIGESPRIDAVELHHEWRDYLVKNSAVVRGWVMWHWLLFLQIRNPSRPNIAAQLETKNARSSLNTQRDFWKRVITWGEGQTKCIYSAMPLDTNNFTLDHYIPFDFVGHNRLWNLVPVKLSVNSAKSNSLPHAKYFDGFVAVQHKAISTCLRKFPKNPARDGIIGEYETDMGISVGENIKPEHLRKAYQTLTMPLIEIARSCGFPADWKYRP